MMESGLALSNDNKTVVIKEFEIFCIEEAYFAFTGFRRSDLEYSGWYSFQEQDGAIYHISKDKIISIIETELEQNFG